eukprot:431277_1
MAEEKQEKQSDTSVANYSKKRIFTCEEKEERIHEEGLYRKTLNVEYGYGVPFTCWVHDYKPEDFKGKDFDIIKHKVIKNKKNAIAYIHDNEDENEPSEYPLLIDINNGEFGFLLPRKNDTNTYQWIQYDNIKYATRMAISLPVNGYNNKKKVHVFGFGMDHAVKLGYYGNISKNEGCVSIKIERNKKQWDKDYSIKDIEYTGMDLQTFYSQIEKAKKRQDTIEAYYHDKYPDTFPLLIVIPLKVSFLVPSAGDKRDFSFLYKKENNGNIPHDFDLSLEKFSAGDVVFAAKYDKKSVAFMNSYAVNGGKVNDMFSFKIELKTKSGGFETEFSEDDGCNIDVKELYNKIKDAKKEERLNIYFHDEYDRFPLLMCANNETWKILVPRIDDKRDYDDYEDETDEKKG